MWQRSYAYECLHMPTFSVFFFQANRAYSTLTRQLEAIIMKYLLIHGNRTRWNICHLLHISGSRLLIQHSYNKLQVTDSSVKDVLCYWLATQQNMGLQYYLMALAILWNTKQCLSKALHSVLSSCTFAQLVKYHIDVDWLCLSSHLYVALIITN